MHFTTALLAALVGTAFAAPAQPADCGSSMELTFYDGNDCTGTNQTATIARDTCFNTNLGRLPGAQSFIVGAIHGTTTEIKFWTYENCVCASPMTHDCGSRTIRTSELVIGECVPVGFAPQWPWAPSFQLN
jgi:hypothetical protein